MQQSTGRAARPTSAAIVTALLGVALATSAAIAAPAQAAPTPPATVDQITAAVGVETGPSDYVLLVDTSLSMTQDGRAGLVRSALTAMLAALDADDRVALFSFDVRPTLRYRGLVGSNPATILTKLPAPSGEATDIGLAVEAGVAEFERPDARNSGAVLLFTDGKVDTEPGARFATAGNAAWKQLRTRAAAIQDRHQVAPLAIRLTSSSDAVLLTQVFEGVTTVDGANLGTYLTNVSDNVERAGVRASIASDLKAGLVVTLDAVSAPGGTSTLTITSKTKHLPLTLSGVTLAQGVTVKDAPPTVDIAPGATLAVPVTLDVPATATGDLPVKATLTSSWQQAATKDLGLTWNPSIIGSLNVPNGTSTPPSASASASAPPEAVADPKVTVAPWMALASGGVGLLALGALGARALAVRGRRLTGSILVTRHGEVVAEQMLQGASVKFADGELRATLTPLVEKRSVAGVRVAFSGPAKASSRALRDRESMTVGATTIRWTSQRTRMLDMIHAGLDLPAPADPDVDPALDPALDPAVDPDGDPALDPGVDPGADPSADPDVDPDAGEWSEGPAGTQ